MKRDKGNCYKLHDTSPVRNNILLRSLMTSGFLLIKHIFFNMTKLLLITLKYANLTRSTVNAQLHVI